LSQHLNGIKKSHTTGSGVEAEAEAEAEVKVEVKVEVYTNNIIEFK